MKEYVLIATVFFYTIQSVSNYYTLAYALLTRILVVIHIKK